jgi:ABC-type lipoprotein export system ATPase subunit
MKLKIQRTVDVQRTPRVLQLEGLFEVPPSARSESTWAVDLPIEAEPWQVGLIVGPSGSGKSTLAREAFPGVPTVSANTGYDWPANQSLVDGFPAGLGIKDITAALSSVGFSSPPSWLRPFANLSTGEQFRATVARALVDPAPLVVLDEFTSVVDRNVAQIGSAAVAKAVRRLPGKQVVCVTCHHDVEEWLCPDWVVEMPNGEFTRRALRRRPAIDLEIRRVHRSAWELFKHHHYLNTTIHVAARCFVAFWRGEPVAFASSLFSPGKRNSWREHRTVCLPDYQGVGIGNALSEYVAGVMKSLKGFYYSVTSNPAMMRHRAKSPLWVMHRQPTRSNADSARNFKQFNKCRSTGRLAAGFRFVGPARPDDAKKFGL